MAASRRSGSFVAVTGCLSYPKSLASA